MQIHIGTDWAEYIISLASIPPLVLQVNALYAQIPIVGRYRGRLAVLQVVDQLQIVHVARLFYAI